jgi:DNA end-binding protein Ku
MARPISRGVLSFGLVAIPVELHTATRSQNVSFHLLHAKCGSRVRNQYFCPDCNEVVERDRLVRGYEIGKGRYIQVTDDELEALEAEANSNIELKEFIPIKKVDPFTSRAPIISRLMTAGIKPIDCSPTRWRKAGGSRWPRWWRGKAGAHSAVQRRADPADDVLR